MAVVELTSVAGAPQRAPAAPGPGRRQLGGGIIVLIPIVLLSSFSQPST